MIGCISASANYIEGFVYAAYTIHVIYLEYVLGYGADFLKVYNESSVLRVFKTCVDIYLFYKIPKMFEYVHVSALASVNITTMNIVQIYKLSPTHKRARACMHICIILV